MNTHQMKAIISTKYGGPEILQLQVVDKPTPKAHEVRVKIYAASVTRAETMMRTGMPLIGRLFMGLSKPKNTISGTGFAGEVEAVGQEVQRFKVGDSVFGESLVSFGTYAEYVCIEEDGIIALKPPNISYEEAAIVGDGPITSLNFLKQVANVQPGQHVLINGASGSLGTAAVQIAKLLGAKVTGVCSARNAEMVKSLGADHIIDYTIVDFTHNQQHYDVIYDTVGTRSFSDCKNALTSNGIYMSPVLDFSLLLQMLLTSWTKGKKALFSATGFLPVTMIQQFLREIKSLMEDEKLHSVIDKCYSLEETADAHRYIDTGHKRGNVVISMS